ncbi:MAG: transcriptional regulator [Syntrophorhabdales bacterium]
MNMVTLGVTSREAGNWRFLSALKGNPEGAFISFESPALLFRVFSGKRWDLLKVMAGAGPMTIREASRRAGRDVKAVHSDIQSLLKAGILEKTDAGKVAFPFDAVHVDFMVNVV